MRKLKTNIKHEGKEVNQIAVSKIQTGKPEVFYADLYNDEELIAEGISLVGADLYFEVEATVEEELEEEVTEDELSNETDKGELNE